MKVVCTVEHLKNAVATTERFTGRHITLPILSYLLFHTKEKKILINATNLEIGVEYTIQGKVVKPGTTTAPAKTLSQILQSLTDETVTLEVNEQQLTLQTASNTTTLIGMNPDDFPKLPTIKNEHSFTIPTTGLTDALSQVLPAVATIDLKPELSGILFSLNKKTLTLTGTDSFRLAEKTIQHNTEHDGEIVFIVPARTIQEVLRTSSPDGEVRVSVGEHQVIFEWSGIRILSRLIDGAYPPYKNLFPKTYETTIVVNRDELLKKIRLAAVFSSRLNDVTLHFSQNELEVTTTNTETGTTTSRLGVKGKGKAGSVVFNHRYLFDGVEASGGENVILNLNGVTGPTLIQNPNDASFLYLLMPIRSV